MQRKLNFKLENFIKIIIIEIDTFSSTIIDERHFSVKDEFGIKKFKKNYDDDKHGRFVALTIYM